MMKKKIFSFLLVLSMVITMMLPMGLPAYAASDPVNFIFDISEGNITIEDAGGSNLRVKYGAGQTTTANFPNTQMITIIGTTVTNSITMQAVTANVTIDSVNVQLSADSHCAFGMNYGATGNLTLTLVGNNILKSGNYTPGLQVGWNGRLTVQGTGSLAATGGMYSAGIGDRFQNGIINILGGTIYAQGGQNGSGIGSGSNAASASGNINILGGTIVATGYASGAGIGPGLLSTAGNIKIMAEANVKAISDETSMRAIVTGTGSLTADSTAMILMANTTAGGNKSAGTTTEVYFKDSLILCTSVTPTAYYRSVAFSVPSIGIYQLKSNSVLQRNNIPSIDFEITGAGLTVFNGLADETYSIANIGNKTFNPITEFYGSGTQEEKTITITRTGSANLANVTTSLSGGDAGSFEITQPVVSTLNAGTPSTTFKVKAKDGLAAGTHTTTVVVAATGMINVPFTITQVVNPDTASVATAKGLVEGAAYTMTQSAATNEAAVKAAIEAKIATLALGGVGTTVTKVLYTPAVAGTAGTPAGTNGTYTFTVDLTKGAASDTTATLTMTITATAYDAVVANAASVATVKGLVEGAAYTMTQSAATNEDAVKDAIEAKIATLALDGVGTTVTKVLYTPAVAGIAGTPAGTNGTYTFTVDLTKGAASDTTATLTMTITATAFDVATANTVSVATVKGLVEGATYTMTQAAATNEAAVKAAIEAKIATLALDGVGTSVTKVLYTPAVAGTAGTPAGTNGTYTFTVDLTKGAASDTTATLTMTITATAYVKHSSGGGGGSSTPVTKPSTDANILVNGDVVQAGTSVDTKEEGITVTTVTIDEQKLEQKLETEGNNTTITIQVKTGSDVQIGVLNGQMVKNMENMQAVVEIKTDTATYTLPAQQINISNVSKQLGTSVELKDIKVVIEISKPTDETLKVVENSAKKGEFSIIAPIMEFNVSCTYGDKTIDVSKFNNYVERTVAIPDGVDQEKITTGVIIDADGTVRHVPTKIIIIDGKYFAKINSVTNSSYSVIWNPIEFTDAEHHWGKDEINDMGSRMVISGMGNNMFEPDRDITRAEFAAIMIRSLGLKPGTGNNKFTDIKSTDWYLAYIETAYEYGIISGYDNERFGPMDKITREQAMTMVARAMKITGLHVELTANEAEKILSAFEDSQQSSLWSKESMTVCIKAGIVSGKSSSVLAPKDKIKRAEVAIIVRRLLQKSGLI